MSPAPEWPHPNVEMLRDGAVLRIRIDREEALGALSRPIVRALSAIVDEVALDRSTRVVLLTGTGRGFVAGADIGEYDGARQDDFDDYQRLSRSVFDRLEALPQITIAAVNGYALGGGFEIALCCDLIVASAKAKFGLPEITLGLLPGGGGSQRLARAAGARFAKELILTGRFARAEELRERGIVSTVCEPDALLADAGDLAQSIAGQAPLAARAAKRLVDDGLQMAADVARTVEQQVLSRLFATADAKEGIAAFSAKRAPVFRGR